MFVDIRFKIVVLDYIENMYLFVNWKIDLKVN